MGIADIFSKREQRASGSKGDVFVYDNIPKDLRVQVVYIIRDVVGHDATHNDGYGAYKAIHDVLAREYGVHQLGDDYGGPSQSLFTFIEQTGTAAQVFDAIEISFRVAEVGHETPYYRAAAQVRSSISDATTELNQRFLEAGVGYQYERDQMIRVDSRFAHAEIVKPALALLSDPLYEGAQEEFLKAHKNYRGGDYKGCLTECGKAFESTMKAICDKRNWAYQKTDAAKTLIDICLKNDLIPSMLQSELHALQTILGSGVPPMRNKLGAHGQGTVPTVVPQHVAAYALHLTAANILLLAAAERNLP